MNSCRPLSWALLLLGLLLVTSPEANASVIDTYAGGGHAIADGTPLRSLDLSGSTAIAVDANGRLYVAVPGRILRLGGGIGRTVVGTGQAGFAGDGGPAAQARIGRVAAIAFDHEGRLLFADQGALRIRRVEHDGTVATVAGNGIESDAAYSVPALEGGMTRPMGLAVASDGWVYVSTEGHYIRCFVPGDNIGNCFGTGSPGFSGDGWMASAASMTSPTALAMNDAGSLLLVDRGNNRVRRIDRDNIIQSIVGHNAHLQGGVNANLTDYSGVAVDAYRRVYFVVRGGNRVYRISHENTLEVFAGSGAAGLGGDGGQAVQAVLDRPEQVAIAPDQTVYVLDQAGSLIRRIQAVPYTGRVPSAPSIPQVDGARFEAFIRFEPPSFDGGSPVTGYDVQIETLDGSVIQAGDLSTFRRVTGVDRFSTYTFRVRARNARGAGAWSGASAPLRSGDHVATYAGVSPLRREAFEGDAGWLPVTYRVQLNRLLPNALLFDVRALENQQATPGVDFDITHLTDVEIPAGQWFTTFDIMVRGEVLEEYNEMTRLVVGNFRGAEILVEPQIRLNILDDDGPAEPLPDFLAVDDVYRIAPGAGEQLFDVLANDRWRDTSVWGLSAAEMPMMGTLSVHNPDSTRVDDDLLVYVPDPGARGEDIFSYRLFNGLESSEAWVRVMISPFGDQDLAITQRSGSVDVSVEIQANQSATSFQATSLAPARHLQTDAAGEAAGRLQAMYLLPEASGGSARHWRLLLDAEGEPGRPVSIKAGVDINANLTAELPETRCSAAVPDQSRQRCEMLVEQSPGQPLRYWLQVEYLDGGSGPLRVDAFDILDEPSDGSLAVTGPPRLAVGETADLRVMWDDSTILRGQARAGYVHVLEGSERIGGFLVRLDAQAAQSVPVALVPGKVREVALATGEGFSGAFIEVPHAATRLRARVRSSQDVDLVLSPVLSGDPATSRVIEVPDPALAPHQSTGPGGVHTLDIAVPAPGRWFLGLRHGSGSTGTAKAEIEVEVEGAASHVRPGSYFNSARSGHGLFLYPAGNQLAGLWYTYLEDGSPTWYYLQGVAPGPDGIWAGDLYRSSWLGDRNALVKIGQAQVAPRGTDQFQFSYQVDGIAGSEPMASLGRGCPRLGSTSVDASSQWFDPRFAGTGYSVQLWPDYEFYAAFVYDERGVARFLTAEAGSFLGAQGLVEVEQLANGPCPSCDNVQLPDRVAVGGLLRRLGADGLEWIDLDAVMQGKAKGDWTSIHRVQLLGGEGTTQGCAP